MTKTIKQLQSMSEKAAEFLGDKTVKFALGIKHEAKYMPDPAPFFVWDREASYLMHLAKREAKKMGLIWESSDFGEPQYLFYEYDQIFEDGVFSVAHTCEHIAGQAEHENEFIAFWDALLTAIGGQK